VVGGGGGGAGVVGGGGGGGFGGGGGGGGGGGWGKRSASSGKACAHYRCKESFEKRTWEKQDIPQGLRSATHPEVSSAGEGGTCLRVVLLGYGSRGGKTAHGSFCRKGEAPREANGLEMGSRDVRARRGQA